MIKAYFWSTDRVKLLSALVSIDTVCKKHSVGFFWTGVKYNDNRDVWETSITLFHWSERSLKDLVCQANDYLRGKK